MTGPLLLSPTLIPSSLSYAAPLPLHLAPLLAAHCERLMTLLGHVFPPARLHSGSLPAPEHEQDDLLAAHGSALTAETPLVNRPRLLLYGDSSEYGQSQIAANLLHQLEELPIVSLDYATLHAEASAKSAEEACVRLLLEAKRKLPAVVFLPHIDSWYHTSPESLRFVLESMLQDMSPSLPLLLLATSDAPFAELPQEAQALFAANKYGIDLPTKKERAAFFRSLKSEAEKPVSVPRPKEPLPVLAKAPPQPRPLSIEEKQENEEEEKENLRELRMNLRDCVHRILSERKFRAFEKPVDPEEVPDYYQVVHNPICLDQILARIDAHRYLSVSQFMEDVYQLASNAKEYNPTNDPQRLVSKANHLVDNVEQFMAKVDKHLVRACEKIAASRPRPQSPPREAPKTENASNGSQPRNSARLRGEQVQLESLLEVVEPPKRTVSTRTRRPGEEKSEESRGRDENSQKERKANGTRRTSKGQEGADDEKEDKGKKSGKAENNADAAAEDMAVVAPAAEEQEEEPEAEAALLDQKACDALLSSLVACTEGYTTEHLHTIYSDLFREVHRHRKAIDKTALLQDWKIIIDGLKEQRSGADRSAAKDSQ